MHAVQLVTVGRAELVQQLKRHQTIQVEVLDGEVLDVEQALRIDRAARPPKGWPSSGGIGGGPSSSAAPRRLLPCRRGLRGLGLSLEDLQAPSLDIPWALAKSRARR